MNPFLVRTQITIVFLLGLIPTLAAAQTSNVSVNPSSRQILQASIAAMTQSGSVSDSQQYVLEGLIELGDPGQGQPIKVKSRSSDDFRFEFTSDQSRKRATVIHKGHGETIDSVGNHHKVTTSAQRGTEIALLPTVWCLSRLSQLAVADGYRGTEQIDGSPAYHIRITTQSPNITPRSSTPASSIDTDLFIDVGSFLPVKLSQKASTADGRLMLARDLFFSDYRTAGATLAPFSISESVDGQHTWTIKARSIRFDVSLTDSDFSF